MSFTPHSPFSSDRSCKTDGCGGAVTQRRIAYAAKMKWNVPLYCELCSRQRKAAFEKRNQTGTPVSFKP